MEIMFIVYNIKLHIRTAAFASYDDAAAYIRTRSYPKGYLVETVEEDEDLFHTINR